jgi:hypothetical protein
VKKLKVVGISFLLAGAVSFVWSIVVYIDYLNWLEMIREKCSNAPCMTPINTSMDEVNLGIIIGSILSAIGITLLVINRKK